MQPSRTAKIIAVVAIVFGVVTLVAGGRVLLGADPGYIVFRPLLQFNTTMGAGYVAVGLLAWRSPRAASYGAAIIAALNLLALTVVGFVYSSQGPVATASIQAMALRAAVWLVLFVLLVRASRNQASER